MKQIKSIIKHLYDIICLPVMRILPGHIAYFLVLSVVPILMLVVYIASQLSVSIDAVFQFMMTALPKQVSDLLFSLISVETIGSNVAWFIIVAFFLAGNGASSIIIASDTLYGIKQTSFIKRRIKSTIMTIFIMFLFFFILVVLAFGNSILKWILSLDALQYISNQIYFIFILLKWPVAFLLIFFTVKLLYTMAPDAHIPSKYINKGAIFTTLGWSLATAIYSLYANNFANYARFYGSLSSIIVLMIWIYILSYILVIGIAINTTDYQNHMEKNTMHNE